MEDRKEPQSSNKNRVTRRQFLTAGGAIIASAVLFNSFSSCTTSNTTTSKTTTASTTTATSTSPVTGTAATPKYGGTMQILTNSFPNNSGWPVDPTINQPITQLSCDTLLRGDNKGNIIPWLAESYKLADDQKSITLSLRKGVKFHDQSDFNASVAKWNLDNFIEAGMQENWASVDVLDDYTIRVNFTKWQNTLLSTFVEPTFTAFMVSKAAFDKNGQAWMREHPVGTGPFIFDSAVTDVSYKVKKNPDWWVKGKPYLDGINYTIVVDEATRNLAMKSGEGDVARFGILSYVDQFSGPNYIVKIPPATFTFSLIPDTANADSPWANEKVREAVEYAIDKEGISKTFGYGLTKAPYQIIPRACTLAYDPDFKIGRKYDLEKAKQLIAEAGGGFETSIIINPTANKNILVAVQGNLEQIGIKVNLEFTDMGAWVAKYVSPNANWHNAALYTGVPTVSGVDFATGLQFVFNSLGQSWLRTPEMTQAYQDFYTAPTVDIQKIHAVTDMIIKNAAIIPVNESLGQYTITKPNVVAPLYERSNEVLFNAEDWWFNK